MVVARGNDTFILECRWDEAADDYAERYGIDVYALAAKPPPGASWQDLIRSAVVRGRIRVDAVRFDETRRQFVDASCLPF